MSLDLLAYSDDPTPVSISELSRACKSFGYEIRLIRGDATPLKDGFLETDDAIVGWRRSFFGNRTARRSAEAADWKAIGDLQEKGTVASCAVELWHDPDEYNESIDLTALEDAYGPEYAASRLSSRVCWYIRLAFGRSAMDVLLAESVLHAMLALRGGMFEDPQAAQYQFVSRRK